MTSSHLNTSSIKRIKSFKERVGENGFLFLCHTAVPFSITSELIHSLRTRFQTDVFENTFTISREIIADILLSYIFRETRYGLYELEVDIKNYLVSQLISHPRFGKQRVREISSFLMEFFEEDLRSSDVDVVEIAQLQCVTGLSYNNPARAVRQIASAFNEVSFSSRSEVCRFSLIIDYLDQPLRGYDSHNELDKLIAYIRGFRALAHDNINEAKRIFSDLQKQDNLVDHVTIYDIKMPLPESLESEVMDYSRLVEISRQNRRILDSQSDFVAFNPTLKAIVKGTRVSNKGQIYFDLTLSKEKSVSFNETNLYDSFSGIGYPPTVPNNIAQGETVSVIGQQGNYLLVAPLDFEVKIERPNKKDTSVSENTEVTSFGRTISQWLSNWLDVQKTDWREIRFIPIKGKIAKVKEEVSIGQKGRVDFQGGLWSAVIYLRENSLNSDVDTRVLSPGSTVKVVGRKGNLLYVQSMI